MNMDFSNIGNMIHQIRVEKNLTVEELAKKLNTSVEFVNDIESGIFDAELLKVIDLCDFFNISIYEVLNKKNENKINYIDKNLYESILKCNMEKQKLIYNIVKSLENNKII